MRLVWDFCLPKMFLTIFDYIGTLIHTYKRTPDYSLSNLDQPININFCSWLSMTCIWQKIVLNGMPMIIFDSIHVHHWLPNFNLLSQSLDSRRGLTKQNLCILSFKIAFDWFRTYGWQYNLMCKIWQTINLSLK